jgi:hypothetical protein
MELFRTFSWKDWPNHKTSAVCVPCRDSSPRLLNTFRIVTAWPPFSVHVSEPIFMLRLWPKSWHHVVWQGYPSVSTFNGAEDGGSMLFRNFYTQWLPPRVDTYSPYTLIYSYMVKSGRMRWAGHVARMGEDRVVHKVLVGKPEGKKPLGRPRRIWEDNIKTSSGSWRGWWGLNGVGSG